VPDVTGIEGTEAGPIREIFIDFRNMILHRYANNLEKTKGKSDIAV
jgi:7-cyano-7-deazaguanine synthase in queuosine biosynthesis